MDLHEKVSLLMDGEKVSKQDIKNISSNDEALKEWSNCHLVGDLLRGDIEGNFSTSFMNKFNVAFAKEPIIQVRSSKKIKFSGFWRYIGQGAIAASVAALSVLGINYYSSYDGMSSEQVLSTTPYGGMASPVRAKIQTTTNSIQVVPTEQKEQAQDNVLPFDANKISNQELAQIEALLQDHEFQSRVQRQ